MVLVIDGLRLANTNAKRGRDNLPIGDMQMKLKKGQCGVVRGGRRMCVRPLIGARFVSKDFDAAAAGLEDVTAPEQPKLLLAAEVGADATGLAVEDMEDVEVLERHLESPVFVQAVATGVANVLREALAKANESAGGLAAAPSVEGSRPQHSERANYA